LHIDRVELTSVEAVPGKCKCKVVGLATTREDGIQRAIVAEISVVISDNMICRDRMGAGAYPGPPDRISHVHGDAGRQEFVIHRVNEVDNLPIGPQRRNKEDERHGHREP
jgi:hypothetical protein